MIFWNDPAGGRTLCNTKKISFPPSLPPKKTRDFEIIRGTAENCIIVRSKRNLVFNEITYIRRFLYRLITLGFPILLSPTF